MNNSLSIFLPFYNDAGTVELMITHAYQYGQKLTSELEVIAVNDGSTDHTLTELTRLKIIYPQLKIVSHECNMGYGGALISGIKNSTKSWVFYTDGDAQYHLDEMELLWHVKKDCDVVNGYKLSRSDGAFRKYIGLLYSWLIQKVFKTPISDIDCDYRLMKGDMLRSLVLTCTSGAITVELIKKFYLINANFKEVGVHHYSRVYGQSAFFNSANIAKTIYDEYKLLQEFNNSSKKSYERYTG
jgi:glycosyltransferase involved in cell wall biosynthesis